MIKKQDTAITQLYTEKVCAQIMILRDFFASTNMETLKKTLLSSQDFFKNCASVSSGCSSSDFSHLSSEDWLEVEYDFNRLFVGPDKVIAPLFASVYLEPDGVLMGDYTIRMRHLMEELDLAVPTLVNGGTIPEDFLAYELEVLCILNNLMFQNQENIELFQALQGERVWLVKHLKAWLPLFMEKCQKSDVKTPINAVIQSVLQLLKTVQSTL